MNIYTRNIAALLKISLEEALTVQNLMEEDGFDFSEATTAGFNREAKYQFKNMTVNA
jgi:hypothetical protein